VAMALQKAQATCILRRAVIARKDYSWLGVLLSLCSLSLVDMVHDMVHVTNGSFSTYWFHFLCVACLFGLFACLDFDPSPLFLFLLGCFIFIKFGKVSSLLQVDTLKHK